MENGSVFDCGNDRGEREMLSLAFGSLFGRFETFCGEERACLRCFL